MSSLPRCIVTAFKFTFVQSSHTFPYPALRGYRRRDDVVPRYVSATGDHHTGFAKLPFWFIVYRYDSDNVQCHHSKLESLSSNAEGLEVMLIKLYLVGSLLVLGAMNRSLVALITCLPDIRRFWVVVGVLQARKLPFQNYASYTFSCLDTCGDLGKLVPASL